MKPKIGLFGIVLASVVLALAGGLRDVTPTRALIGRPIQPFYADFSLSGFATTALGATTPSYVYTHIPQGVRISIPSIFSAPGYTTPDEAEGPGIGVSVGGVRSVLDVLCDGVNDIMAPSSGVNGTYPWLETTTAVAGTPDAFLIPQVPPYPWIFRDTANPNNFWIAGTTPKPAVEQLTTVYTTVPWSPNGGASTATTKNNGQPHVINASGETVCIDSPENTDSVTAVSTNPPALGDSGGPCTGGNCADAAVYGPSTADTITSTGLPVTINETQTYVNRGPNAGNFTAHLDIEVTNPAIMDANWNMNGGLTRVLDMPEALAANAIYVVSPLITFSCVPSSVGGEGLVVIKTTLWPTGGTKDYYPADNSNVFVAKVICGEFGDFAEPDITTTNTTLTDPHVGWFDNEYVGHVVICNGKTMIVTSNTEYTLTGARGWSGGGNPGNGHAYTFIGLGSSVDKHVVEVVPTSVSGASLPSTPYQVNLLDGTSAHLAIKEVKANNSTVASVSGNEWLVADAAPNASNPADVISRSWGSTVTVNGTTTYADSFLCGINHGASGPSCIGYDVSEPKGQSTVNADLTVACPPEMPEGRYSVVVEAIDASDPASVLDESSPPDNAQRFVIMVNCWTSASDFTAAQDGIDDGAGLYPRWAIFQSNPDARLTFASPPSFTSDQRMDTKGQNPSGGYIERSLDLECFWHDANGCQLTGGGSCDTTGKNATGDPGGPPDGYIDAAESHSDSDLVALHNDATGKSGYDAIDADHDCLVDQGLATASPGPTPGAGTPTPGPAPAYPQPGHPVDLPTWAGTNPPFPWAGAPEQALQTYSIAADRDGDGLPDGVEVAYGSNPLLPDSDSDGATDYQEMFQFTNPNNPDTDGDGYMDKPSGVFGDNTNTAQDNCPTAYNPTQLNSDGKHRPVGILYTDPIVTSNNVASLLTDASATWTQNQWRGQTVLCLNANGSIKAMFTVGNQTAAPYNVLPGATALPPTGWNPSDPGSSCPGGFEFTTIATGKASNPNKDKMGDACDPDNDNDGLPDASETVMGTDPLNPDTNYNHCVDGNEAYLGGNPATPYSGTANVAVTTTNSTLADTRATWTANQWVGTVVSCNGKAMAVTSNTATTLTGSSWSGGGNPGNGNAYRISGIACPTSLTLAQVKSFRACRWSLPSLGAYGGLWDAKYSTNPDRSELDPDGDGIKCTDDGTTVKDTDNDNGTGTLAVGAAEVSDIVEIEGYNTNPAMKDTDGDGCEDWVQINDINGDGIVNVADTTLLAKRLAGVITADPVSDEIFDVTHDNKYNVADSLQMAKNTCSLKPWGGCGQPACKTQVY